MQKHMLSDVKLVRYAQHPPGWGPAAAAVKGPSGDGKGKGQGKSKATKEGETAGCVE